MLKTEYEFLSSNAWINYPFVDGPDIEPADFQSVIVDAAVVHNMPLNEQLVMKTVDLADWHVRLETAGGALFFDDQVDGVLQNNSVFGAYRTLEWFSNDGNTRVLLTVNETRRTAYAYPLTVGNGTLLDRTVIMDLPSVRRFNVQKNSETDPSDTIWTSGDVKIASGINVATSLEGQTEEGPRQGQIVRMDAAQGLGESASALCDETVSVLKTINGQGPDANGNLMLDAKGCIWWSAPWNSYELVYNPVTEQFDQGPVNDPPFGVRHLKLHNDCEPCCSCDDYEDVYRVSLRQNRRLAQICDRLVTLRDRAKARFAQVRNRIQTVEKFTVRLQTTDCRGWQMCVTILLINSTRNDITGNLSLSNTLGTMTPIVDPPSFRVYDGRGGYNKWRFVPADLSHSFTVQKGSFVLVQGSYRVDADLSIVDKEGAWTANFVTSGGSYSAGPEPYTISGNVNKGAIYEPSSWSFKYASWWRRQSTSSWSWYHSSEAPT